MNNVEKVKIPLTIYKNMRLEHCLNDFRENLDSCIVTHLTETQQNIIDNIKQNIDGLIIELYNTYDTYNE